MTAEINTGWNLTGPLTGQYGKRLSGKVYKFKNDFNIPRIIDLTKFDFGYQEIIINHYGYTLKESDEHFENIVELYGDASNWIIAGCIFEMEQ